MIWINDRNMSCSHESTMANFQFTSNSSKQPKLSTIIDADMESKGLNIISASTRDRTLDKIKNTQKSLYISKHDISELRKLDLKVDKIPFPHKRCIFISIAQLNACIDDIPLYILSESIFCFKAARAWFFPKSTIEKRNSLNSIRGRLTYNPRFWEVLKDKDAKKLILWLQDGKSWKDISNELMRIEDCYYRDKENYRDNNVKYKSLILDKKWWLNEFEPDWNRLDTSMFCSGKDVIKELRECKLKFNPTMELLFQSNPTLVPMRNFDMEIYLNHHYKVEEIKSIHDLNVDLNVTFGDMDVVGSSTTNIDMDKDVTAYHGPLSEQDSISKNTGGRCTLSTINISKSYRPNFSKTSSNLVQITPPAPSRKSSRTPNISNSKSAPFRYTWSSVNIDINIQSINKTANKLNSFLFLSKHSSLKKR